MDWSDTEIQEYVCQRLSVTRQKIAVMKGLLVKNFSGDAGAMLDSAVRKIGIERPQLVNIRLPDVEEKLTQLAAYFSWYISGIEAVWRLVGAGVLLPGSERTQSLSTYVRITTIVQGSGRTGVLDFPLQSPIFPQTLVVSGCKDKGYVLDDPDLYLESVMPHVAHEEVKQALEEAVRCFRAELYLASVVMLGKASEGIWIELGKALFNALPTAEQSKNKKFRADLDNVNVAFAKKLREIMQHYEARQAEYAVITKSAALSLADVRLAHLWADGLRESRNAVHYGTEPDLPHNYENVATLLLAGSKHIRNLFALSRAAAAGRGT